MNKTKVFLWMACVYIFSTLAVVAQTGPPPLPPYPYLDSYSFDETNWLSDWGYAPIGFTNLAIVSVWDGDALLLDTTNAPPGAYLSYRVVETNGFQNISFPSGTMVMVFINTWASADTNQGGSGPGEKGYLLGAGDFTSNSPYGLWGVWVDASGTNLTFGGVSNGTAATFVSAPISWPSNAVHLLGIAYPTNGTTMYLDGAQVATGSPVSIVPATNVWSNGFFVGSDAYGYQQARAVFWDLEFGNSNCYTLFWSNMFGPSYFTNWWASTSNAYYTWLAGEGGGFSFSGRDSLPPDPTNSVNTNYTNYSSFWLEASNVTTNINVRVVNTLSNITYEVLTNGNLSNPAGWNTWQVFLASNSISPMPSIHVGSNAPLYFRGVMISQTGTNGLPDWWQMEYFHQLGVDPFADPDGDLLCNLDEFMLGTNPTNAHSISTNHTDAQALFLAYTNDSACHYHLSITNGSDTNTLLVTLSPTVVGTNYQIYSRTATNAPWIVETNFLGTNTSTTVVITINGRTLSLIGGYGEDDDGDGLPNGYEVLATLTDPLLADTGITGTADGYRGPDNDGFCNLQEMFNGTDPHVFNMPSGPQDVASVYTNGDSQLLISWQAASGPVENYVIYVQVESTNGLIFVPVATNLSTQLTYLLTIQTNYETANGDIAVQAICAGGGSSTNEGFEVNSTDGTVSYPEIGGMALINGPGGKSLVVTSGVASNVLGYTNFVPLYNSANYPEFAAYGQAGGTYSPSQDTNIYMPISQFTNNIAVLDQGQAPEYLVTSLWNIPYQSTYAQLPGGFRCDLGVGTTPLPAVPFIDGSAQMKQNIRFLLQAAGATPFSYFLPSLVGSGYQNWDSVVYPTNYVYSSLYYSDPTGVLSSSFDHFAPFEDNYFFRNFAFDSTTITTTGTDRTGFSPGYDYYQNTNAQFEFPTYSYVTSSNGAPVPGILASNIPWVGFIDPSHKADFGVYYTGTAWAMSNYANIYGLPYDELATVYSNNIYTLSPGGTLPSFGNFYAGTAQPTLQTVGYYFARFWSSGYGQWGDPLPGYQDGSFSVTNATPPVILTSVGNTMIIAGYAKQALLNGNPNVFAYLGQYFTNAFSMTNGSLTTNSAGILSEYGEFFSMVPGHVGLVTMPDSDQTNRQGICEIDSIRLSLDVNHDGIMDESFTGPDNSSTFSGLGYVFWINNDYDRWDIDNIDSGIFGSTYWEEDDVQQSLQDYAPDYDYEIGGNRCIPCPRDLEDYARLWVSGVSNTLSRLPIGSTVTVNWGDVGAPNTSNPTIDLFQAADIDGGIGYLTNLTTASNQINTNLCQYIGRLGPGSNIVLNASTFSNNWAENHYIWCGVASGSGTLSLTISDSSGNVLAQSSVNIQIQDIKNMYERWTVGDSPGVPPQNIPSKSMDNLPSGSGPFSYAYNSSYDTNDTYILSVHGYNVPLWEAERFSETMYKRLYWQGYQGRFGEFHWPCRANPLQFDKDELTSWESGTGLYHLLNLLDSRYPGNVFLFAHSLGNVAAGQALLAAGTNQVVNTYIAAQGAISAHAYDSTTPTRTPTSPYSYITPDCYAHYSTNGAPCYFNGVAGAGAYFNFFNSNDWALTVPWPFNQDTKPDENWKTLNPYLSYNYVGTNFYSIDQSVWGDTYNPLSFPTDTFSIFSFCDQSQSQALGAQINVAGAFKVGTNYNQINLQAAPYNYTGLHIYHSGEFRSDNMQRWPFWNKALQSYHLK